MSAWVSREWLDPGDLNKRGKPKRKREKTSPGIKGIKADDRFVVCFIAPDGRLKQERIRLVGKPGKKLADRRAEQLTAELTLGEYESANAALWPDFRDDFTSSHLRAGDKSAETVNGYTETLRLFEAICKPRLMRAITAKTVDDFRTGLARRRGKKGKTKLSPATINKHLRHLRTVLNKADKWELLAKPIHVEMLKEPDKEITFVTPADFDTIYNACETALHPKERPYPAVDWWRALLVTGIMTGMRRDEMLTLSWDEVHLDEGYLQLRHDQTKGRRDDRIPLHPIVVEHLRKITDFGVLVFNWPFGPTALYDEFYRIQKEGGIDLPCRDDHEHTDACHRYSFHDLKRACGTLNAAKMPKRVLNAFMRHRSSSTTEQFYINKEHLLFANGLADEMFVPGVLKDEK